MKFSSTNKKILIFGAVFIIFTVIVAFVSKTGNAPGDNIAAVRLIGDYKVSETSSGRSVVSGEAGFSLVVPEGWIVKNYGTEVNLFSSEPKDAGVGDKSDVCMVNIKIKNYPADSGDVSDLSSLMGKVSRGEKEQDRDFEYVLEDIKGRKFLKTIFRKDDKIIYITAQTIRSNNIYYISSGLISSDGCVDSFNSVLNTVNIK